MGKILLGFTDLEKKKKSEKIVRGGSFLMAIGVFALLYGLIKSDSSEIWYEAINETGDTNILEMKKAIEKNVEK